MPAPKRNPFSMSDEPMAPTGATDEDEIKAARAANRFDIRRTPHRHLGFGYGIRCCGSISPRPSSVGLFEGVVGR